MWNLGSVWIAEDTSTFRVSRFAFSFFLFFFFFFFLFCCCCGGAKNPRINSVICT